MKTKLSAINRARDEIDRCISVCKACNDTKLPSVREIAKNAAVSIFTVSRVLLNEYREKLNIQPKTRITLNAKQQTPKAEAGAFNVKWERVKFSIEKDILTGKYSTNPRLPPLKMLSRLYGASFPTLKKATEALLKEKKLVMSEKGFRIPATPHLPESTILLITRANDEGIPVFINERSHDFFWVLERLCHSHGVTLNVMTLDLQESKDETTNRIRDEYSKKSIIGTIFISGSIAGAESIVTDLLSRNKPVAVLDENNKFNGYCFTIKSTPITIVNMESSSAPGRKTGEFIINSGLKKIFYLTDSPVSSWSLQRFTGLQQAMTVAGLTNAVTQIIVPLSEKRVDISNELCHSFVKSFLPDQIKEEYLNTITRKFAHRFENFICKEFEKISLYPFLEEILGNSKNCAWVAVNDPIAIHCVDFLKTKSKKQRENIMVVGFDNYIDAQLAGFSSYDFNFDTAARTLLNSILVPDNRNKKKGPERILIEGFIVQRKARYL